MESPLGPAFHGGMTTPHTTAAPLPRMTEEAGVRFGIAVGTLVLAYLLTGLTDLGRIDTALAAIIVGGIAAAALSPLVAPLLGLVSWAFYTGFVEHDFGQLSFAGADLARLLAFVALTAVIAHGVRQAVRPEVSRRG